MRPGPKRPEISASTVMQTTISLTQLAQLDAEVEARNEGIGLAAIGGRVSRAQIVREALAEYLNNGQGE